jgi:hypothetical protein
MLLLTLIRFAGLVLAILASAWGMTRWLIALARGPRDQVYRENLYRFLDQFGLNSDAPSMVDAWARIRRKPYSLHDWKNLTTEWVRLDAQRAAKFMSFVIVVLTLGHIARSLW